MIGVLRRPLFLAGLLLADRFQSVDELGHGAHHAAHDAGDEDLAAGRVGQGLNTRLITGDSVTVSPDAPYLIELNGFSSELTIG